MLEKIFKKNIKIEEVSSCEPVLSVEEQQDLKLKELLDPDYAHYDWMSGQSNSNIIMRMNDIIRLRNNGEIKEDIFKQSPITLKFKTEQKKDTFTDFFTFKRSQVDEIDGKKCFDSDDLMILDDFLEEWDNVRYIVTGEESYFVYKRRGIRLYDVKVNADNTKEYTFYPPTVWLFSNCGVGLAKIEMPKNIQFEDFFKKHIDPSIEIVFPKEI